MRPVVLVHGIWDSALRIAPLADGLTKLGVPNVVAMDLIPPWGNAPLEVLAAQVERFVSDVREKHDAAQVDLVGFSMGGLVCRAYLALLGGHRHVRTFVSISAPHHGTWVAYTLPLPGVRQMRPGSAFLAKLGHGVASLGDVAVHCIYTPYDAAIVPGVSGVLEGARSVNAVPVLYHRWMLSDPRVHHLVVDHLRG